MVKKLWYIENMRKTEIVKPFLKRFDIPQEEKVQEAINITRKHLTNINKKNPEVSFATLFGSVTKGGKDIREIDINFIIDTEKMKGFDKDYNIIRGEGFYQIFPESQMHNKEKLAFTGDLARKNIRGHIIYIPINKEIIDIQVDNLKVPKGRRPQANLRALFNFAIAPDSEKKDKKRKTENILKYRKYLLNKLKNLGSEGEEIWSMIVKSIERFETYSKKHRTSFMEEKYYPRTLKEARKIYLGED